MSEIVEAERVIFKDVTDEELATINKIKNNNSKRKYFTRMKLSAIIIILICAFHGTGLILDDNTWAEALDNKDIIYSAVKESAILAIAAFLIYNAVSLFYTYIKRELVVFTENYYILLEAKLADKHSGKDLSVEGKTRKKYYAVFECDQGVCSKAVEITKKQYKNMSINDAIVIVKCVTVDGNEMKCLKEDEFRSVYNSIVR